MIDWLLSVMYWFARPSIAAWAGATATIVACFLLEPRRNLRHPLRFLSRVPRVVIVWLIFAWILSQLAGRGMGGAGRGGGMGDAFGNWVYSGTTYGGSAASVRIRFLQQPENKTLAASFVCFVRLEEADGQTVEKKIAGDTLLDFEQQLERVLKSLSDRPARVLVEKQPAPGEGVLRLIHSKVERLWPSMIYEEVEP